MPPSSFSLRARYVLPVTSEPIEHGVVTVAGGKIVAVGPAAPGGGKVHDLGEVALLPGLINAHTHLELSDCERPLGTTGLRLVDWIPQVVAHRAKRSDPGPAIVAGGLFECLQAGTTALADTVAPGFSPAEFERAPIRAALFQELIAPTPERADRALERARRHLESKPGGCWQLGLSPHAPYTVRPELLDAAIDLAARSGAPVAMHLAESLEEVELLATGNGPFRAMLESLGAWSDGLVPVPARPLDYLRKLAAAPYALIVHGNCLNAAEWDFLAERRDRMSVVYCPRSHAHFDYPAYPLGKMLAAGVNVCLGTDSRASAPDLSLLAEMRFAAERHPDVRPATLVELATRAAACALGCHAELGRLVPGMKADLTAVTLPPSPDADPCEALLHSGGRVVATWIEGTRQPPFPTAPAGVRLVDNSATLP